MSTLRIKSDAKKMSVAVDGVELIGLGISRLETKMESNENPTAIMAFDFCDHDVDIDGAHVTVDGVRLPVSVSVAIVKKIAQHLIRKIGDRFDIKIMALRHGGGEDARRADLLTEMMHGMERDIMRFVTDVSKGVEI